MAVCGLALGLAGCGGSSTTITPAPRAFIGAVVTDEPRAAQAGRDVLTTGGRAADAAAAAYLALAVTLPSQASLGGGGLCLVYDVGRERAEAIDFTARPAGRGAAIPAAARGVFALHAKYGRLRWAQIVAPAEGLARFGAPVSRALAADIAAAADRLRADDEARRLFLDGAGAPLAEGARLVQPDLANILAAMRARGANDLHAGASARLFLAGMAALGLPIDEAALRAAQPEERPSVTLRQARLTLLTRQDDILLHFAPPPASGGLMAAQTWLMAQPRWSTAREDARAHLLAEVGLRALVDRARWRGADGQLIAPVPEIVAAARADQMMASLRGERRASLAELGAAAPPAGLGASGASIAVVDREGSAVTCTFGLNAPFGIGRVAPGTGIVVAAHDPTGASGDGPTPMIALRTNNAGMVVFAGAVAGGRDAPQALIHVALRTIIDERPLENALEAARVFPAREPDATASERQSPELAQRGHLVRLEASASRVNAIYCPEGLIRQPWLCEYRADPRGFGLALGAE